MRELVQDENYWNRYNDWVCDNNKDNPDNWTWNWFFANDVIRNLKSALGIQDT